VGNTKNPMGKKILYKLEITKLLYIVWKTAVYIKNKVTLFLQTLIQALVTPSERHLGEQPEGSVAARVVGASTEASVCSADISQRELRELKRGFAETELLCS
jgi:hypothetical protein